MFKKQVGDVEKYVEQEIKKDTKYAQEKFVDIGRDFRDAEKKVAENVSHEVDKVDEVAKEIEKMPKKYYEYHKVLVEFFELWETENKDYFLYYKRKYDKIFEEL